MKLNKAPSESDAILEWNQDGDLTKEQFDELSLRYKKFSNAVGILSDKVPSGIRHDAFKI